MSRTPRKAPKIYEDPDTGRDEDDADDHIFVTPPRKSRQRRQSETESTDEDDLLDELMADQPLPAKKEKRVVPDNASQTYVNLDNRKLTKKEKQKLGDWESNDTNTLRDVIFAKQTEEARKQFGHSSVMLGSQSENLVIGIPTPALAFEYVIAQNCFPLGLVLQIVAKHGVGKSGLLAEFGRWFDAANGGMVLCENETKFNPFWYQSIMGKRAYNRMQLHRCRSVEDWQRHLTSAIKLMQAAMLGTKDEPGPGKRFPVLFGVDSIMGKMSEENQEKILGKIGKKGERGSTGEGFAQSRSYPVEAGSITKYLRTIPQEFDNWPFALVLINHLRMKQDDAGNPERNKTGGEQVNFQESFELEIKKVGGHKKKIVSKDFEGTPIELSCEKNSFGSTHRKAKTRILWWHEIDEETGNPIQVSTWDWDWATIALLHDILKTDYHGTYVKSRLKESGFHLECPATGEVDNTAWSKSLGMSASDALSWAEVGAMIREDTVLMNKIRDALIITRRPWLHGDYGKQIVNKRKELP